MFGIFLGSTIFSSSHNDKFFTETDSFCTETIYQPRGSLYQQVYGRRIRWLPPPSPPPLNGRIRMTCF